MVVRKQQEQRSHHANEINIVFGVVEHQWEQNQSSVTVQFVTSRKKTQEAETDTTRQRLHCPGLKAEALPWLLRVGSARCGQWWAKPGAACVYQQRLRTAITINENNSHSPGKTMVISYKKQSNGKFIAKQ